MNYSFKALASIVAAIYSYATASAFGACANVTRGWLFNTCSTFETVWYINAIAFVLTSATYIASAKLAHEFKLPFSRTTHQPAPVKSYNDDPFEII
jgi:hypothetical protein